MGDKTFLDKVYGLETTDATRAFYDDWSGSYEDEVAAQGYVTPIRVAEALAKHADLSTPVLDVGCGTGLSGAALKQIGFSNIDGVDLSEEMLAEAGRKGVYRTLAQVGEAPMEITPGTYGAIVATGVIGAGAAPLSVFDTLLGGLAPGGLFAFSFNDHTLEHPEFAARVVTAVESGEAEHLFEEHGAHLPGIDLKSVVYVLRKT